MFHLVKSRGRTCRQHLRKNAQWSCCYSQLAFSTGRKVKTDGIEAHHASQAVEFLNGKLGKDLTQYCQSLSIPKTGTKIAKIDRILNKLKETNLDACDVSQLQAFANIFNNFHVAGTNGEQLIFTHCDTNDADLLQSQLKPVYNSLFPQAAPLAPSTTAPPATPATPFASSTLQTTPEPASNGTNINTESFSFVNSSRLQSGMQSTNASPSTSAPLYQPQIDPMRSFTHSSPNQVRVVVQPVDGSTSCTESTREQPVISFETSKLAHLTDGAVVASCKGTLVMATAVGELQTMSQFSESVDLRTEAREKSSARGYIPPGFLRTDMGASEYEILLSRMIDRSIRPLFGRSNHSLLSKNYSIQVTSNLLSCDETHCTQALAINAVSASIHVSGIPWDGPIGAVRVAYIPNGTGRNGGTAGTGGELIANPTKEEVAASELNLVYVGLKDGKCLMIETDANEADVEVYKEALRFASKQVRPVIEGIEALKKRYEESKIVLDTGDGSDASRPVEIITSQHGMLSGGGESKLEVENKFRDEILSIKKKIYDESLTPERSDEEGGSIVEEFKLKFKELYGDTRLGKHDRLPLMHRYRSDYFDLIKQKLFAVETQLQSTPNALAPNESANQSANQFAKQSGKQSDWSEANETSRQLAEAAEADAMSDPNESDATGDSGDVGDAAAEAALVVTDADEELVETGSKSDSAKQADALMLGSIDSVIKATLYEIEEQVFRDLIIYDSIRCDGRQVDEIRNLTCMNDILPAAHGSSLFQRGNTQVLVSATLGSPRLTKVRDLHTPGHPFKQCRLFFQYEMPRWSTNEIGNLNINRRAQGHGALARKALDRVIPGFEEFRNAVRLYSTVTASNGSSSMASVCGGSLALMDAGVPMPSGHVAGISIGLVSKAGLFDDNEQFEAQNTGEKHYMILTDLMGIEDSFGDMDFKIAGTKRGITAVQLDMKLVGIPVSVLCEGLDAARTAHSTLINAMNECLPASRTTLKPHAPKMKIVAIDPKDVPRIIGSGGQTIQNIQRVAGCELDIAIDGMSVEITAPTMESLRKAQEMIKDAVGNNLHLGSVLEAKVLTVQDYGVMIETLDDGCEHLIPLAQWNIEGEVGAHVKESNEDLFKPGDEVSVMCINAMPGRPAMYSRRAAVWAKSDDPEDRAKVQLLLNNMSGISRSQASAMYDSGNGPMASAMASEMMSTNIPVFDNAPTDKVAHGRQNYRLGGVLGALNGTNGVNGVNGMNGGNRLNRSNGANGANGANGKIDEKFALERLKPKYDKDMVGQFVAEMKEQGDNEYKVGNSRFGNFMKRMEKKKEANVTTDMSENEDNKAVVDQSRTLTKEKDDFEQILGAMTNINTPSAEESGQMKSFSMNHSAQPRSESKWGWENL